ncbi:Crp/Fnr family transcriptional regulator [Dyadobacter frigoris]|uniref:Crp/Fnr family transcriptional regulator n=1 Tax=Dyadobacter frigoris TaxID=2576211 RepID=A0A4U6CWF1_9BACT|nr:Crp/Fnr family transcriptional regulator [Dyadobacter frigoris]TKT88085.1 Crp/Fnr family transcriptional regulator [Dyadobacter frigoris]GLU53695.1 cyclic nucleotide-binding protein [Dyadobacter frigoris]
MLSVFKKYLTEKATLSEEEWEIIASVCIVKKIRKQQFLLEQGEVWRYNAFVCEGCLRRYSIDDKGIEHIIQFSTENWWAGDRQSLMHETPSKYNVDAIENSVVILIRKADFEIICKKIPAFYELSNAILQRSFNASQERINAVISLTAEEKYLNFLTSFPGLANRVPRHMVASYLGITPETLSRIKKQVMGK